MAAAHIGMGNFGGAMDVLKIAKNYLRQEAVKIFQEDEDFDESDDSDVSLELRDR